MKLVLLALLSILPAAADWQRQVLAPKGPRFDYPGSHPLAYFTDYPSLLDATGDFCFMHSPEECLTLAKKQNDRAEVKSVGRIRQFSIYDVFYFFGGNRQPTWKSILVQIGTDEYREIVHYQANEGGIWPSYLVKAGDDTLLGFEDDCYRRDVLQDYYWFGNDGPVRVDFTPVWQAANRALPKGLVARRDYDGRTAIPSGRMSVAVTADPGSPFDRPGAVDVVFHIRFGQLVVTSARYNPNAEFKWGPGCR